MTVGSDLRELQVPEHRPGFFDDLREELDRRTTRVTRPRLLLVATAAAIVAGALAFGLTRGSGVAAAAQVEAAVHHALASDGSISGVIVNSQGGSGSAQAARTQFLLSSTGAFRTEDENGTQIVYDPAQGIETVYAGSEFTRYTGLATSPPDTGPAFSALGFGLGSIVAALAEAHDARVDDVTYEGRPAWLLHASTRNPDEQDLVTVDRATGIPVRDQVFRGGDLVSELRIEDLSVTATVPKITLPLPPNGQAANVLDSGFRPMSLAEAGDAAGYSPLVPKQLPDGYALAEVGFAARTRVTGVNGGGGNPGSEEVISLAYRHGFDEIFVSTRRTVTVPSDWGDPLQIYGSATPTPESVTFTGGALAGEQGYLVFAPGALPHIWVAGPKLVVTITGVATRAELLEVANSLGAP